MENEFAGPTYMFGPGGQSKIVHKRADVPEGWTDNPKDHAEAVDPEPPRDADGLRTDGPTLAEYVAAGYSAESYPPQDYASKELDDAPAAGELTREQVVAALNERNIPFKKNAPTKALYKQLLAAVEDTEA